MPLFESTSIQLLSALGMGIFIGVLCCWWILRERHGAALLGLQSKAAAFNETVRIKSDELRETKDGLNRAQDELRSANSRILQISEERAAALSRLEFLSTLESAVKHSEKQIAELQTEITALKQRRTQLETVIENERGSMQEKIALLGDVRSTMTDAYKAISANALENNNRAFLDLAKSTFSNYLESAKTDFELRTRAVKDVVMPVKEALNKYDEYLRTVEREREKAYGGLTEQVISLAKSQTELQKETGKLVKALRVPHVRGRWGEITLRRVAELAGMKSRCDFFEQTAVSSENGPLRPDMIVTLPEHRQIVVDAKVPLAAYLDALEAETDEKRDEFLRAHARQVQNHIQQLGQKAYWAQFQPSPEFVVLFIPGENFFSAALSQNPGLIESGVEKGVILATPTTLISLLKTVSFAWRQEAIAENAKTISALGSEIYERLNIMAKHIHRLGRDIDRCSGTFNQLVGSFEKRVFSAARKFHELGIRLKSDKELPVIEPVETKVRVTEAENGAENDAGDEE